MDPKKATILAIAVGLVASLIGEELHSSSPAPSSDPAPTPTARLTPEGVLVVIKRFTEKIPGGLHGFSVGKEVRLVRDEGDSYVVLDGDTEGRAPKDFFTNDLDKADKIVNADRQAREAYASKVLEGVEQENSAQQSMQSKQRAQEAAKLEQEIRKLEIRAEELKFADERLRQAIASKGRYDGLTDLWALSEKSKRALTQNEEAQHRLKIRIERLKADSTGAYSGIKPVND